MVIVIIGVIIVMVCYIILQYHSIVWYSIVGRLQRHGRAQVRQRFRVALLGWHYLSNATCLMRPRLFYALCIVSKITIICQFARPF